MRPVPRKGWERLSCASDANSCLQPLLPEEESPEVIMPLQELQVLNNRKKEYSGYRKLEILVDSGAAASVLPEGLLSD